MLGRWPVLGLTTVAFALAVVSPAGAVAPANDTAAGAFTIPDGPYPATGQLVPDITDATPVGDPPPPSCEPNVSRSVWYRWTPSQTRQYLISTAVEEGSGSTVNDTVLAVYTSSGGDAGAFTEVPTTGSTDGCDNDSAANEANQSTLAGEFTGGTTYYVVIWKFDTPAPTVGNTAVQPVVKQLPPRPPGDTAAGAPELRLDQPLEVDDTSAANDYQLPGASPCFAVGNTASTGPGRDSVYTFTAPSAGSYGFRVSTLGSTSQNLVVYLATAAPSGPAPATVATCTQAFNRVLSPSEYSGEVATDVNLNAGQKIFIFVDRATAAGLGGLVHLDAFATGAEETEPNNTPAQAGSLSCGIRGAVNPATEADFYSVGTPAAGSRIFAMADAIGAGPSSDIDMRLNSATDTLEYDDLDGGEAFGVSGFAPVLAGRLATGIPLFLQMDRFGTAPSGVANPYYLYSVVQPSSATATAEAEPNDSLGGATIAVNNYYSGALAGPAPSTDADLYAFEANAGELIFVALDGDPLRDNTPVNSTLQLLDADGNVELTVDGSGGTNTLDNANPAGLFETVPTYVAEGLVWRSLSSGTHYVRVKPAVTGATGVGDYLLSISKNCAIGGGGVADPVVTTTSLPDATVGAPYSERVRALHGVDPQFSVVAGSLPPGMAIDPDGTIHGPSTGPGSFDFTVEARDGRDRTDTQALTIVVHTAPAGPGGPGGSNPDTTAPTTSLFHVTNRKFAPMGAPRGRSKRGTTFGFDLSEAATVKIAIAQLVDGRRVKRRCVKLTRKNRSKPHCKRAVVKGTLSFNDQAGPNTHRFSGRLRGRRLRPGLYQATLVATDAAGNRSKPVRVRFRVVRR